jgi:hypothetical protein
MHSYDGVNWENRGILQLTQHGDKRRRPWVTVNNQSFDKTKLDKEGLYFIGIK